MKYGETLRQRSIPAWSHYNIDYDDIKHYIKDQTTPGKGKTVSVPGRTDEKLQHFENSLFEIFTDQHHRIDLFVRSKAGEIQRRLDHSKRQLQQLSGKSTNAAERRIPVARLERYGRLENDVVRAGDEIKSLARFTSTQRTAFRKLLKKYKKWTGSTQLEDRFRTEVLDSPKSFTKLDLGPLLDDYSSTLQQIRSLYEARIERRSSSKPGESTFSVGSSVIPRLQFAIESSSKVEFDTAIATVPLGESGTFASYFVHPENVVELQVLLLQHSRYSLSRSRSNSLNAPISSSPTDGSPGQAAGETADYFALEADDAERFAKEQNATTIKDREHRAGSTPQKARLCVRWSSDEEAQVTFRSASGKAQYAGIKKKFISSLFDRRASFSAKKAAAGEESEQSLSQIRQELERDESLQPLYTFASCRSRFVGTNNTNQKVMMATLDTHTTLRKPMTTGDAEVSSSFPFAVLLVRQEGAVAGGLLSALDQSHLVERVRGFSMEYHGIWQMTKNPNIPAPFWLPVFERDIRKLPPPAIKGPPRSADRTPSSAGSVNVVTDSTTAVETTRSDSNTQPSELEGPPIRAFRKKRRRNFQEQQDGSQQQQRYWSEYDHPEDGSESGDAYVIYIDPNQQSAFDTFFDRMSGLFSRRKRTAEDEALLTDSGTPKEEDDETSSEEDNTTTTNKPRHRSYGTLTTHARRSVSGRGATTTRAPDLEAQRSSVAPSMPHATTIAFVASLIILGVAYILATTGRHKYVYEVDFGVIFAVASSLFFSIAGFASLLRQQEVSYPAWGTGVLVLVVDAVGSGGLLAWMLG